MVTASIETSARDRQIGLRVTKRTLAPHVLDALGTLGYVFDEASIGDGTSDARVILVDADLLETLPSPTAAPDLGLLMVASPRQGGQVDSRVLAETTRPGHLGSTYAMIQRALERNPRSAPRVPTHLSARCIRADRRSIGSLLSLSEGGCLLHTTERLTKGCELNIQFAMPDYGLVSTRAECRYVREGNAGLAFASPPPDVRNTIAHYVTLRLASHPPDEKGPYATSV